MNLEKMGLKELSQQEKEQTNGGGKLAWVIGYILGGGYRAIIEENKNNPYGQK